MRICVLSIRPILYSIYIHKRSVPVHAMKVYGGSKDIVPLNLNLGIR